MSSDGTIRVNFGRPMGLFPLSGVVLLPQQVMPLHIFEPRYRQLIGRSLDGAGQFAMASFAGQRWKQEYHGRPPIRPAVCVAQIVQHETLGDGRFNVLIHGVCRARVERELPAGDETLFREAVLEPLGEDPEAPPPEVSAARRWAIERFERGGLGRLAIAEKVGEYLKSDAVPDSAAMDVLAFALVREEEARYALLSEPDAAARARLVRRELSGLDRTIVLAACQRRDWPKGMSWN
jgi:hypothetical protein